MPNTRTHRPAFTAVNLAATFAVLMGLLLGVSLFYHRQMLADLYLGHNYVPSEDMAAIRASLRLTPEGLRIFNASHPTLESQDDFNTNCESHNPNIAIYGCYNQAKIHIYNVKIEELPGFLEATTAHEFLHAVWERLSSSEQAELTPLLSQVYQANRDALEETIADYPQDQLIDELYVRSAVQLADLPTTLEEHYARYFTNRSVIVAFYDSYITPFNELNKQIATQKIELNQLRAEIETKNRDYDQRATIFTGSVARFNACAATVGCFRTLTEFDAERASLVNEQYALNKLHAELESMLASYNTKVASYNSNVLLSNTLQSKTNSNAPPSAELVPANNPQ